MFIIKKYIMKINNVIQTLILIMTIFGFYSCSTIPKGAVAVKPFKKEKYLGKSKPYDKT